MLIVSVVTSESGFYMIVGVITLDLFCEIKVTSLIKELKGYLIRIELCGVNENFWVIFNKTSQ